MQSVKNDSLGLVGYHSIQFYTSNLTKTVDWHKKAFGFKPLAKSTVEWEKKNGMRSVVLNGSAGTAWIFTEPTDPMSSAGRYLERHPDGVGYLNFRVKDLEQTSVFLAERKAPFLYDISRSASANGGIWHETAIASPLDDVGFRFIEENNFKNFAPGFEWIDEKCRYEFNLFGLDFGIDHVTSNGRSMHAITEFYRCIMGFEQYWGIEFHTSHYKPELGNGSGLESIVMWDKESKIKFATNQPLAPYFNNSQIQIYIEDNNGSGVQHVAIGTKEIIPVIEKMRRTDIKFLEASDRYYENLPVRMKKMNLEKINEPMEHVRKNNILLDGSDGKYLLQIFMKEQNVQMAEEKCGPFFYEIIQRAGDEGFGEGNFKALFDSIEKEQLVLKKQEMRDRIDCL